MGALSIARPIIDSFAQAASLGKGRDAMPTKAELLEELDATYTRVQELEEERDATYARVQGLLEQVEAHKADADKMKRAHSELYQQLMQANDNVTRWEQRQVALQQTLQTVIDERESLRRQLEAFDQTIVDETQGMSNRMKALQEARSALGDVPPEVLMRYAHFVTTGEVMP